MSFTCPYCSMSTDEEIHTHYGCDVHHNGRERYVMWSPCCLDMQAEVERWGFKEAYGVSLIDVVREIAPDADVLEVTDGTSNIIGRLTTYDPAEPVGEPDVHGIRRAKSPSGFRDQAFSFMVHHRHHEAPTGHKFSIEMYNAGVRVGVAVVSRPVSRVLAKNEPTTMEVTRVCTHAVHRAMTKNASSKLYSACCKKAKKLGATKLITYTLFEEESGHSLVASGWVPTQISAGGSWNRSSRAREDKAPTGRKVRWEKGLNKSVKAEVESRRITIEEELSAPEEGFENTIFEGIVDAFSAVDEASVYAVSSFLHVPPPIVRACVEEALSLGILRRASLDIHHDVTYALG